MESGSEFGGGRQQQQNTHTRGGNDVYVRADELVFVQDKQHVAEDRLLTPEGLQTLLLLQFEIYCNMKKPESLKDKVEVGASGQVLDEATKDKKNTANKIFGAVGSFFKKTAAVAYEHTRTHTTTTEFVANEMAAIMRQSCSALKKMTDLTILFHGLHRYISTRNSVDFRQLLDEALESLWAGTPQQGQEVSKNNIKFLYKEKIMFEARFDAQIVIAQKLIAANTTLVERALYEKAMREGTVPLMAGSKYNPQDWQYRCSEVDELGNVDSRPATPTAWMGDAYNAHLTRLGVSYYIPAGEAAELRPLSKPARTIAAASSFDSSQARDDFYDGSSNYEPVPLDFVLPANSPPPYSFLQEGDGANNNNAPALVSAPIAVEIDPEGWQVFPMADEQAVARPPRPSAPPASLSGSSSLANSFDFLSNDREDQEKADFAYALALSQSTAVFNGAQARPGQGFVAEPALDMFDQLADDLFVSVLK